MSPQPGVVNRNPLQINACPVGARSAFITAIMRLSESNSKVENELENLRVALQVNHLWPGSQGRGMEPEYVRDQPTTEMTATWGS